MTESRWLSRMPVYDIAKGRVVGRIHRLIVDADSRKVVGLLLATRLGREPRCLPFRHVHAIGEHAVTVRGTDAIVPLSELPDMEETLRAQRRIYNSPILTEGGAFIGDVDEFTINTESGRLEAMLVSGGLIRDMFRGQAALPSHLIVAIGEDATIVKDIAVTYLKERQQSQRETRDGGAARRPAETAQPSWASRLRRALDRRRDESSGHDREPAGVSTALGGADPTDPATTANASKNLPPPAADGADFSAVAGNADTAAGETQPAWNDDRAGSAAAAGRAMAEDSDADSRRRPAAAP